MEEKTNELMNVEETELAEVENDVLAEGESGNGTMMFVAAGFLAGIVGHVIYDHVGKPAVAKIKEKWKNRKKEADSTDDVIDVEATDVEDSEESCE